MLSKAQIDEICRLYIGGRSTMWVAKFVGVHQSTVKYHLKKRGVARREKSAASMLVSRKIFFNEDYFENVDTEGKAYWLGFLAADGCVTNHGTTLSRIFLGLAVKDIDHIQRFLNAVGASGARIRTKNNGSHFLSYVELRSVKMCADLIAYGVCPRKSLTLEWPKRVPSDLMHHWLRGFFDGDGSIFKNTHHTYAVFKLVGPMEFIKQGRDFINVQCGHDGGNIWSGPSVTHLTYRGNVICKKLFGFMYRGASVWLPRKYNRFKEYLGV